MSLFLRGPEADALTLAPAPVAYGAARSLRASAQLVKLNSRAEIEAFTRTRNRAASPSAWQSLAWDYYDEVGEVKYAFSIMANTLSRIRLYAAVNVDSSRAPDPVEDVPDLTPNLAPTANRVLEKLNTGLGGISQMLRDLSLCLSVAGEAYLIEVPERRAADLSVIPRAWGVYSADALVIDNRGNMALKLTSDARVEELIPLPPKTFIGRIWRSHPRWANESDSSMRGLLGLLEELLLLNRAVRATARSRLNAGMLYLPDGLSAAASPLTAAVEEADADSDEDEFENELIDAMTTPIADESSASAVVPLIVRGPAELGEKIKQFQFERSFDPSLAERADRVLERILQGIDVPKEIVSGLQSVKYCASVDTEILTQRGWLGYEDLTTDDVVLTLNHDTGLSEWQPVRAINTFDVVDEPMLSVENRGHSSLTTLDHRWPVSRKHKVRDGAGQIQHVFCREVRTSGELDQSDRIHTAAPLSEFPSETKYTDDFVELVAWYWTEGWTADNGPSVYDRCVDRQEWTRYITAAIESSGLSQREIAEGLGKRITGSTAASAHVQYVKKAGMNQSVDRERLAALLGLPAAELHQFFESKDKRNWGCIVQSHTANPEHTNRILGLLTRMAGDQSRGVWSASPTSTGATAFWLSPEIMEPVRQVAVGKQKVTSLQFIQSLTRAQLELFIDVSMLADGHYKKDGSAEITQAVSERLDALELACILTGRSVHRYVHYPRNYSTNRPVGDVPVYHLKVKKRTWAQPIRPDKPATHVPYTGVVWCPTTDNHTWMARRNGTSYFTSNSNAVVIDDQFFRSNVEPLALLICDALTTVFLRPHLKAMGFTDEQAARVVIWYDPSAVQTRPNRGEDANAGYDRFTISGSSWRKMHGFSEADKPSPDEVLTRLVVEKGQLPDALTEALLRVLAPNLMQQAQAANPDVNENLPPEVQQALGAPPSAAPAEPSAPLPEAEQPSPTPDAAPPSAYPEPGTRAPVGRGA